MKKTPYCYFKGKCMPEAEASLPLDNLGTVRGFGIFDFFRMRNGRFSFLEDHLRRFDHSQKFLGLSRQVEQNEIKKALKELCQLNEYTEAGFKLVLLGDGMESDATFSPLFYILHTDLAHYKAPTSAKVILHEYQREDAHVKSTNYFTSLLLHKKKKIFDAIDVIYHSQGYVSEASRGNVFVVKDGVVYTPDEHILAGITRKYVLLWGQEVADFRQQKVHPGDLLSADEVFLSSTLKEVCPVVSVEGKPINGGEIGPITKQISRLFQEKLNRISAL